jgi:hypothetical protein
MHHSKVLMAAILSAACAKQDAPKPETRDKPGALGSGDSAVADVDLSKQAVGWRRTAGCQIGAAKRGTARALVWRL